MQEVGMFDGVPNTKWGGETPPEMVGVKPAVSKRKLRCSCKAGVGCGGVVAGLGPFGGLVLGQVPWDLEGELRLRLLNGLAHPVYFEVLREQCDELLKGYGANTKHGARGIAVKTLESVVVCLSGRPVETGKPKVMLLKELVALVKAFGKKRKEVEPSTARAVGGVGGAAGAKTGAEGAAVVVAVSACPLMKVYATPELEIAAIEDTICLGETALPAGTYVARSKVCAPNHPASPKHYRLLLMRRVAMLRHVSPAAQTAQSSRPQQRPVQRQLHQGFGGTQGRQRTLDLDRQENQRLMHPPPHNFLPPVPMHNQSGPTHMHNQSMHFFPPPHNQQNQNYQQRAPAHYQPQYNQPQLQQHTYTHAGQGNMPAQPYGAGLHPAQQAPGRFGWAPQKTQMQVVNEAIDERRIIALENGDPSTDYPAQQSGLPAPDGVRTSWDRWQLMRLRLEKVKRSMGHHVTAAAKLQVDQGILGAQHNLRRLRMAGQYGWDVLKEYEERDLAQGSTPEARQQDSEKIRQSVKRANKTRGGKWKKKKGDRKCFTCGSTEHMKADCPKEKGKK